MTKSKEVKRAAGAKYRRPTRKDSFINFDGFQSRYQSRKIVEVNRNNSFFIHIAGIDDMHDTSICINIDAKRR